MWCDEVGGKGVWCDEVMRPHMCGVMRPQMARCPRCRIHKLAPRIDSARDRLACLPGTQVAAYKLPHTQVAP